MISQCIGIEKLVLEVHAVTERCVQAYCAAETRSHRCKQFDELTCMLGEGREASAGTPWLYLLGATHCILRSNNAY